MKKDWTQRRIIGAFLIISALVVVGLLAYAAIPDGDVGVSVFQIIIASLFAVAVSALAIRLSEAREIKKKPLR